MGHRKATGLLVLLGAATSAVAQEAPPAEAGDVAAQESVPVSEAAPAPGSAPDAAPRSTSRMVEEIVVTAQKREENLQDVPISVSAFSAEQLDARGIEEPKALQLATPGMQYNIVASYTLIYIRGVGTDAFIPSSDASVATYIDGIYYPMGFGLAAALGSIERVEVLKGPQGTLFGRNTTGGAINIITKQPGDEMRTEFQASHESYDKTNLRIFSSIPLTDDLAFSVSGLRYGEDTFYDLAADSPRGPLPRETSRAAQAKLRWTPGELDVTLGGSYVNSKGSYGTMSPVAEVRPLGVALGVHREPDYEFGGDTPNYTDTTTKVVTLDAKYALPWFDTRVIGGKQTVEALGLIDYDGSTQPLLNFEGAGQFADVKTAELQVISNADSWGAGWLTWIGGVYYLESSAGYDPLFFSAGAELLQYLDNPPVGGPLEGLTSPLVSGLDTVSDLSGVPLSSLLNNGVTLNLQGVLDTNSIAYFAQSTANLTDELALTVGGRFQDEERKLAKSRTRLVNDPEDKYSVTPLFDFGTRKKSFTNFSPKVALDYKFADDQMLYTSWARGFKSGTFNIIGIYTPTQYVKPEEVTTIELGYKSTLLDGNMRFNAAIFQNKIKNLQVQTISLTSGGAVAFETAGAARIRGAEFDMVWELAPSVVPGLVLTAAGSYLDGEYTDYENGSGFDDETGLFFAGSGGVLGGGVTPGRDFTGNDTVRTPEWSGNAGLSYTFGLGDGSVEIAGDAYYNSGAYFAAQNSDSSHQDAYTVANARISYLYEPWDLRVTAFGKNVTDEKYYASIQEVDLGTWKLLAAPATYGVRVQWNF